jgi:hypothetical protein
LRTPDGFTVDLEWANGKLKNCRVQSTLGKPGVIKYAGRQSEIMIAVGEQLFLDGNLDDAQPN